MLRSETVDIWGNQKYVVASLLDGGAASMSGGVQIVRRSFPPCPVLIAILTWHSAILTWHS
jgi:hypothetical protein